MPSPTGKHHPDRPGVLGQPETSPLRHRDAQGDSQAVRPPSCGRGHGSTGCDPRCRLWEATERGRGPESNTPPPAFCAASSARTTGEPAGHEQEGGEEEGGDADDTPRSPRQSDGAEEPERGTAAAMPKALRKRVGKDSRGRQRMRTLTRVHAVELTHEQRPVHGPLSGAGCGARRRPGSHGGLRHEVVSVMVGLERTS